MRLCGALVRFFSHGSICAGPGLTPATVCAGPSAPARSICAGTAVQPSDAMLDEMLRRCDRNADGYLSFNEFARNFLAQVPP